MLPLQDLLATSTDFEDLLCFQHASQCFHQQYKLDRSISRIL